MLEFKIPEVGENIESGNVVSIAVSVGDIVKKDQDLLELETDKASLPVPSPCDGVIKEILIKVGDDVKVGQTVMRIEAVESASSDKPAKTAPAEKKSPQIPTPTAVQQPAHQQPSQPSMFNKLASSFQAFIPRSNESIPAQSNVPAAPSIRRLARELGVEISNVPGTGPGGRISKLDVKNFTKQIVLSKASGTPQAAPAKPLPDFAKYGQVRREKMSKIRQTTKNHMTHCWSTIAHVTQFDKADITELEKIRKANSTSSRKLTVTPFLIKVLTKALKEFPQFNASIDAEKDEIIYKDYINIGVAVNTDRGLLVPVLKDADKKSIFEITDELSETAERARNRKTSLEELHGGSMSITNLGGIGGFAFTPIVNWPEVCILGVSRGGFEPVYDQEQKTFVPCFKLPLCLSYDHRLIDGADAARFLRWICENLENARI
jgi:pyruvate dehydrogenase E2 component (dihydrolipoamide acetyltransferase)